MAETAGLQRGIRILVAFAFIAVAVMLGLAVFAALRSTEAASVRGEQLDPAATTTALLLADFVDQESALRGYLFTEDENFLLPYDEPDRTIPQQMNRLQQLLVSFPELIEGTIEIEVAYQGWRSEVAEPELAAMRAGDLEAAREIEQSRDGRQHFNALRAEVADLSAAIDAEQMAASGRVESAAILLLSSLASAMFVILGVVVTLTTVLRRWLLRPIDALRRAVNSVAAGRYDTRIPSVGPQEIVELAGNIETMRAQLVRLVRQNERYWEALAQQGPAVVALRDALTPSVLRAPGLLLRGRVDPAQGELAGDWYDSFALADGRIGVVVGDVSGHGAVAGVFALRLKQLLDAALSGGAEPGEAIEWVVDSFGETDETFATAVVAVVDPATGVVHYANAGHPEVLHLHRPPRWRRKEVAASPNGSRPSRPTAGPEAPRDASPKTTARAAADDAERDVIRPAARGTPAPAWAGGAARKPPAGGDPGTVESAVVDPAVVESAVVDPAVVDPAVVESAVVDPAVVDPAAVDRSTDGEPGSGGEPAAGREHPSQLTPDQKPGDVGITRLASTGPLMTSLVATQGAWRTETLVLEPGDVLFVYTDGLVEARDSGHRQFGVDRLVSELLRDPWRPPRILLDEAFDAVRRHAPGRPSDDRTAIVMARTDEV